MHYKFGLLIPSKGRPDYLQRLVNFYVNSGIELTLIIGDASNKSCENNLIKISKNTSIFLIYLHWPGLNDRKTIANLSDVACQVGCDYVALTGDDDYLIPNGISKCCDFLEQNSSYKSVQGFASLLDSRADRSSDQLAKIYDYWGRPNLTEESTLGRLKDFSRNYFVLQFSVKRAIDFNKSCANYRHIEDRNWGEIYQCYYLALLGKSHFLNIPYLVRSTHSRIEHESYYNWINTDIWNRERLSVINAIASDFPELSSEEIKINLKKRFFTKNIPFWGIFVALKRKLFFKIYVKGYFVRNEYFLEIINSVMGRP